MSTALPRVERTRLFSTLLPLTATERATVDRRRVQQHHQNRQGKLRGSAAPAAGAAAAVARHHHFPGSRFDNACGMRWATFFYQQCRRTFVQQAQYRRDARAVKRVALDKVVYTFKSVEAAQAEVAVGTAFPGIGLRNDDGGGRRQERHQARRRRQRRRTKDDAVVHGAVAAGQGMVGEFTERGFVQLPQLVSRETAVELVAALDAVLAGHFDTGTEPDKRPLNASSSHVSPGQETMQVINIWKASRAFARVILSERLGRVVATLAGWPHGARLAQDQVWAKPPGAGPLVFHRDSTYFDFEPADVVTVWLALDDMVPELGPLEYIPGSHKWGEGRAGSANLFFDKNRFALVHDAARREGIEDPASSLEVCRVRVGPGGASVHNGRTWHGSGPNQSEHQPRRGLGIHFVPAQATFRSGEGGTGRLWRPYRHPDGSQRLPDSVFPVTYHPAAGAAAPAPQ